MAGDADLLSIFSLLNERQDARVCEEGLHALYSCCTCPNPKHDKDRSEPPCDVLRFVERSPLCIELFQIWAGIDVMLAAELRERGIIQKNGSKSGKTDESEHASSVKVDDSRKARVGASVLRCLALVLEHSALDAFTLLTAHSRESIASRLLKSCTRSLYRLLHTEDPTKQLHRAVGRLLNAFAHVSEAITTHFVETFNFGHPGFRSLGRITGCSFSFMRVALHQGNNLLALGALGFSATQEQRAQLLSRRPTLKLFCSLLRSNPSIAQQTLKMRHFVVQIVRFLCWDAPEDCLEVLTTLLQDVVRSATLLRETKRVLCSLDVMAGLGLVFGAYAAVLDGWKKKPADTDVDLSDNAQTNQQQKLMASVLTLIEELLDEMCCQEELFRVKDHGARQVLVDCPSWLSGLHMPRQQKFMYHLLVTHPTLVDPILQKLNAEIVTGTTALPAAGQPRLTARWLRYATFTAKLLTLEITAQGLERIRASVENPRFSSEPEGNRETHVQGKHETLAVSELREATAFDSDEVGRASEHEFWFQKLEQLQLNTQLAGSVADIVLAGRSRLLTRPVLTAALLHKDAAVVSVGLGLLLCVVYRLNVVKEKMSELFRNQTFHKAVDRIVMAYLPELGTYIQMFQRFSRSPQDRLEESLIWGSDAKSMEKMQVPFDAKTTKEKQLCFEDDDDDEELELPGLSVIEHMNAANGDDGLVEPAQSKQYSLKTLLEDFEASLPINVALAPEYYRSLFSKWCYVLEYFFRTVDIDASTTKFDWTQLLEISALSKVKDLEQRGNRTITNIMMHQLSSVRLLDAVWQLNCFPCQLRSSCTYESFEKSQVNDSILPSSFAKWYIQWFEHLLDLWGWPASRLKISVNEENSNKEVVNDQALIATCQRALERFLQRTGVFQSDDQTNEAVQWLECIASLRSIASNVSYDFVYLFAALLKCVVTYTPSFYAASLQLYRAFKQKVADDEKVVVMFPVSMFTVAMVFIWNEERPKGLQPRNLYLNFPTLYWWPSLLATRCEDKLQRLALGVSVATDVCRGLESVSAKKGKRGRAFLAHLVARSPWNNLLSIKKKTEKGVLLDDELIKTTKKINHRRKKLLERVNNCKETAENHSTSTKHKRVRSEVQMLECSSKRCARETTRHMDPLTTTDGSLKDQCSTSELLPSVKDLRVTSVKAFREAVCKNCSTDAVKNVADVLLSQLKGVSGKGCLNYLRSRELCLELLCLAKITEDTSMLSQMLPSNKEILGSVLEAVLQVCVESADETLDGERDETLDAVVDVWLLYIEKYELFVLWRGPRMTGASKRSHWRRDGGNLKKRYTSQELVRIFHLCRYVRSQFPLHFPKTQSYNALRHSCETTACQTALVKHLVSLAWLRVQLLCDAAERSNNDEPYCDSDDALRAHREAYCLSYGIPDDWIETLQSIYYHASMAPTDTLLRFLIQDPERMKKKPLGQWIGDLYDFKDIAVLRRTAPEMAEDNKTVLSNGFCWRVVGNVNWLNFASQRRKVTVEHFPFSRQFSPEIPSRDSILSTFKTLGSHMPTTVPMFLLPETIPELRKEVTVGDKALELLLYDPAYVLPYLASRLRGAWYVVNDFQRTRQRRSSGQSNLVNSGNIAASVGEKEELPEDSTFNKETDNSHQKILEIFSLPIDVEGAWLRRVASGGALELLILGLGCSDPVLRAAAIDGLGVYRALLLLAEEDAKRRAAKLQRKRVWKLAVQQCRAEVRKTKELGRRRVKNEKFAEGVIREAYEKLLEKDTLSVQYSFKEFREVLTLIELLKNAIVPENSQPPALSSIVVGFAVSCVPILLDCAHPLYCLINGYLTSRPLLSDNDIPMFLSLYWSFRIETYSKELIFGFQVIGRSLGFVADDIVKTINYADETTVKELWRRMNRCGIIALMLGAATRSEGSATCWKRWRHEPLATVLWNVTIAVLLRFVVLEKEKFGFWLVRQWGLLQWVDFQLSHLNRGIAMLHSAAIVETLSANDMLLLYETQYTRLASLALLLSRLLRHPEVAYVENETKRLPESIVCDHDAPLQGTECVAGEMADDTALFDPSPTSPSCLSTAEKLSALPTNAARLTRVQNKTWIFHLLRRVQEVLRALNRGFSTSDQADNNLLNKEAVALHSLNYGAPGGGGSKNYRIGASCQAELAELQRRWTPWILSKCDGVVMCESRSTGFLNDEC